MAGGARTPLRFFADEDADQEVVDYLIERGHDVEYSATTLGQKVPDRSVAAMAEQMDRICLTFNHRDFVPGQGGRGFYGVRLLTIQDHVGALERVKLHIAQIEFAFTEYWDNQPRVIVTVAKGHLKVMLTAQQ
jgi:hypothetical protein